jgi:alpha-L-rhamnosidase
MPPLGGILGYWFYYSLAGIQPDPAAPGFKNVIIKPDFVKDLSWVKGEYKSLYGTIKSEWKRENGQLILKIEVPANTSASVFLPTENATDIAENGKPLVDNKEFQSISHVKGKTVIQTGSGSYIFSVKNKK